MTFEKKNTLNLNQLTIETQYRFIELEIFKALDTLSYFTNRDIHTAAAILTNALVPNNFYTEEIRDQFKSSITSYDFQAKHNELVHYFRYHNLGAHKIRQYITVQLKDLVRGGKYDAFPDLRPVFPEWSQIKSAVVTWNNVKEKLNLFNDKVIQKEFTPTEQQQQPSQTYQPITVPIQTETTKPKGRIIEWLNTPPNTKHDFILETTREDMEESPHIQHAIATGTPYLLVTHYEWEE